MINIIANPVIGGKIVWQQIDASHFDKEEGVALIFHTSSFHAPVQRREALKQMATSYAKNNVTWIQPGRTQWKIDLDAFAEFIPELKAIEWFTGTITLEPEFEQRGKHEHFSSDWHEASLVFYITHESISPPDVTMSMPAEIHESLKRFRAEHPYPAKAAFIMMQFGRTKAHQAIVDSIRSALKPRGIAALRADDKDYHDDLFPNILTYIYGCTFGIAVFERLENDQFNPNVSLEVGYMLALHKPVCLLKDQTLKTLNTDLVGKLYKPFNPQEAGTSIPEQLLKWCDDRNIV